MTPVLAELAPIWQLGDFDPAIIRAALQAHPEAVRAGTPYDGMYPVATTCEPFEDEEYARPVGHARSFFRKLSSGAHLVFKGSEPFATDVREAIRKAYLARDVGLHSTIDQFTLLEHEAFLGLTRESALRCASISAEFVGDYLGRYGSLPKVPIPLAVLAVPDSVTASYFAALQPYLSNRRQFSALEFTSHLLRHGMAVYVYIFGGSPIRLAHAMNAFPGGEAMWHSYPPKAMRGRPSLQELISSWCKLFAEMLSLGYVPTTAVHTGNCMQSQNVTLDGGIVDLESIELIRRLDAPAEVFDALVFSFYELTRTVLVGMGKQDNLFSPMAGHVYATLSAEVRRLLREDRALFDPAPDIVKVWLGADGADEFRLVYGAGEYSGRVGETGPTVVTHVVRGGSDASSGGGEDL